MMSLGWFSSGGGEGSSRLLQLAHSAIQGGGLAAEIQFVFSNREWGEADGSDRFFEQVHNYGIPLFTLSSQRFRREHGGGPFSDHRLLYDRAVMELLEDYRPDLCVLAGYMLIADVELCNRFTMLNLHPALPGGPVGTWRDVIWKVIEEKSDQSGAYIHIVTEDLDRGPILTYCSFPIRGKPFDGLWEQIEGRSIDHLKASEGENLPLFQHIRRRGVILEPILLLETLKAFAVGDIRLEERLPVDRLGTPLAGLCLDGPVLSAPSDCAMGGMR